MPRELKFKTCVKCQESKRITEFYYHRTRGCHMSDCKECNKLASIQRSKAKVGAKDPRHILRVRASGIRQDRRRAGIAVCEDLGDYLCELWELQGGKCFYTGRDLALGHGSYRSNNPDHCSVDRLRPALGYVRGNLVLSCIRINRIMQDLEFEEFLCVCEDMTARAEQIREKIRNL